MRFKIFCVPGDHRDDFEVLENQLNEWAAEAKPKIVNLDSTVTAMTDPKNLGRYIMSVLVAYRAGEG
ncbi:MAG: hypothetical protein ACYSVY_20875 [Planctomycetota bacterium]|jgi:hypothetical protein